MKGLTDAEFDRVYGSEEHCLEALIAARRQAGMACPRCDNPRFYICGRRVGCTRCNRRWSVTAGTVMANTKLPLTAWFRAMHVMSSTKQSVSAVELGRRLGVSYPTAWYLHKRLRHAMTERESRYRLGGPPTDGSAAPAVEADDVYLGGERNLGPGTAGKTNVIVAAERQADGRMGHIAMQVVAGFTSAAVQAFCAARIAKDALMQTDGLKAFNAFAAAGRIHERTITAGKRPARERGTLFFVVNTAIANLSTAIKATHKAISPKHTPDYLGALATHQFHPEAQSGGIGRLNWSNLRMRRTPLVNQESLPRLRLAGCRRGLFFRRRWDWSRHPIGRWRRRNTAPGSSPAAVVRGVRVCAAGSVRGRSRAT
jgi:transposase-like protein